MNNQTNRQLQLSEILSYFEKENLQIPSKLAESFNKFYSTIDLLKGYKSSLKNILNEKIFHFKQLQGFLQYTNEINTFYLDLERFHQDLADDYNKISKIANEASNLVIKLPYVAEFRTTIGGDRVRGKKDAHFYVLNYQELITFLNDIKDLITPVNNSIANSPISDKLKELIDILPSIKMDYWPNVVYVNVPESFEQIILLSEDLKKLLQPIPYLEKYDFFRGLMEHVDNRFDRIQNYFKMNPEVEFIKLKGKFRKAYSDLDTLYHALSFDRFLYL